MKKIVILLILLITGLSARVKPVKSGTYDTNPMVIQHINSNNLYTHLDDLRLFNGELVKEKEFATKLVMALQAIEDGKLPEKRAKEVVELAIRYTDIKNYYADELKDIRYRINKIAKY